MKRPSPPSDGAVGVSPSRRVQSQRAEALPPTHRRRLGRGWLQEVGLIIAIVLLGVYFASRNGVFISFDNLGNIAEQSTFIGILAVAMTFVVVSGQFDLSVGSMYGLSSIVFAVALQAGWNVWLAAIAAIASGAGMGLTNGLLSVFLRVPLIIITRGGA